jgi:ferredoxin-type protein NapG
MIGRHYRLGWEEKQEAGGALVTPDLPHEYNLPEGMRYEHGGRGLIPSPGGEVPSGPALESIPRRGGGL